MKPTPKESKKIHENYKKVVGHLIEEKYAIQRHLESDEKLTNIDLKIRYYDTELKFLEEIIKNVSNRTFQIKNAIEWNRFQAGM